MRLWRLVSLSRRDRRSLLRAQVALLRAQARVWTRARGSLVEPGDAAQHVVPAPETVREARAIAYAMSRVCRGGLFRPSCLVRALALSRMLADAGIQGAQVRIGVRDSAGRFEAHAWVEFAGDALGESPHRVATFAHLTDVRPVGAP
jgi:hypothetical protein